ncbi:MAG TPA: hypothetical protein VGC19_07955 [Rhodanobacter sp.]
MNAAHIIHCDTIADSFAVEEMAPGAKGIAPDAGPDEPDPDWQPV